MTLPDGWDYKGYPGGYVAHLTPGATQEATTLRTSLLTPDGSYLPPPDPSTSTTVPDTSVPDTTTTFVSAP